MHSSAGAVQTAATRRHKRSLKQIIRSICYWLRISARPSAMAACLFLLTFVKWFGIPSPFGAAFLLAVPRKPSPLMLAGLGASLGLRFLWGIEADLWQYAGCLGLWLLLQKVRPRAGVETAALGGLAMIPRIAAALAEGNPLYTLLSCAALPVAMLFAAALRYGMDAAETGQTCGMERFCLLLTGLLCISGLGYFQAGPVALGAAAAVGAAIAFACANGPVYGVTGGVICGVALALGGHASGMIIPLALCGLFAGMPGVSRRRWLCIFCALLANLLAWFLTPFTAPSLSWWAAGIGSMVYALLPAGWIERMNPVLHGVKAADRSMENAFVNQRIIQMQEAIQNLARALPVYDEEMEESGKELGGRLCAQCPNRELCWGRSSRRTEKMLSNLMALSLRGENVENAPDNGCLRAQDIPELAREMQLARQRRNARRKKARYERELTLTHLAALSGTLGELGNLALGESFDDLRAAHIISLAMEELGVPARLSYARRLDGHLQAALQTEGGMPVQKTLDQLLHVLAQEEDMPLAVSRMEKGRIELEEIPLYSASVGMASQSAEGEKENCCGDTMCAKRCEGGRLLMMLCDGMGHGEAAHRQSEKTQELLLLLLQAGYTRHQAITAVNGMMLGTQDSDRFSTVDLVDVDLWTGEVFGEKLGACASWVVRGSHMKKVEGSSLPLGILEEASPTAVQYRLHSGDILILMSDGVADAFAGETELKKALEDSLFIQPQRMADAILRNALLAGGGTPRDDMSVMVLLLMDRQHAN